MRTSMIMLWLCLAATGIHAQKIIEKTFACAKDQKVNFNLKFADSIKIKTWNKKEVLVKVYLDAKKNAAIDFLKTGKDSASQTLDIESTLNDPGIYLMMSNTKADSSVQCTKSSICYEIYLPENAEFQLETINGNVMIDNINAGTSVKTISGFVDASARKNLKANFNLSTITGTIFSNHKIESPKRERQDHHQQIESKWNDGSTPIHLETISGDIYLREL